MVVELGESAQNTQRTRAGGLWGEDFQAGDKVFVLEVTSKRRTPQVMSAARDQPRRGEKSSPTGPFFQKQHTQPLWLAGSLAGALQG